MARQEVGKTLELTMIPSKIKIGESVHDLLEGSMNISVHRKTWYLY